MKLLNAELDLETLFLDFSRATANALLLDEDGTQALLRVEREQAFPNPGVRERIASAMKRAETPPPSIAAIM